MQIKTLKVDGFNEAFHGMRNPLESWDKSTPESDILLAGKLAKAGTTHRKFMRQIMVWCDITAPLYFWNEFDTYKVGTTANSTSKMHKLMSTPITLDRFDIDLPADVFKQYIDCIEELRKLYLQDPDKLLWRTIVQMLPESWLQTRTVCLNYEVIFRMIHDRREHKLTEWSQVFINWASTLPYAEDLLFIEEN